MTDTALNMLGIAKKAGMLEIGTDSVGDSVRIRKARLIISACDAGDSSLRTAASFANMAGIVHITLPYTKDDLGAVVGRGSPGMAAITDIAMAAGFTSKLTSLYPGKYDDALERLNIKAQRAAARKNAAKAKNSNIGKGKRRTNK